MKNLAITAGIAVCIAMSFAPATASPLRQSAAEMIDAKQQTSQTTQTSITAHAANQVLHG